MPAMPQSDAMSKAFISNNFGAAIGYTKREQAAISILSGLVANQFNCNDTDKELAYRAASLAEALFDELEG